VNGANCFRASTFQRIPWPASRQQPFPRRASPAIVGNSQVRLDHGHVQGLMPEVLADEPQAHALLQQIRGLTVAQRVHGGLRVNPAFGLRQPEGAATLIGLPT